MTVFTVHYCTVCVWSLLSVHRSGEKAIPQPVRACDGVLSVPERRVVKRGFPGCEGYYRMFVARLRRWPEWMSLKFGREEPTILSAVFTTRCRAFLCSWSSTQCNRRSGYFLFTTSLLMHKTSSCVFLFFLKSIIFWFFCVEDGHCPCTRRSVSGPPPCRQFQCCWLRVPLWLSWLWHNWAGKYEDSNADPLVPFCRSDVTHVNSETEFQ